MCQIFNTFEKLINHGEQNLHIQIEKYNEIDYPCYK